MKTKLTKKLLVSLLILLFNLLKVYSEVPVFSERYDTPFTETIHRDIIIDYLRDNIPERFLDVFVETSMTEKDNDIFPLLCLSVAEIESVYWRYYRSKPNRDGSIDVGPMGLNSKNLKDERFMQTFRPDNWKELTKNQLYMAVCINLLRDHYNEFGIVDALYVYNGGRKAVNPQLNKRTRKFVMTRKYGKLVVDRLNYHLINIRNGYRVNYIEKYREILFGIYTDYEIAYLNLEVEFNHSNKTLPKTTPKYKSLFGKSSLLYKDDRKCILKNFEYTDDDITRAIASINKVSFSMTELQNVILKNKKIIL